MLIHSRNAYIVEASSAEETPISQDIGVSRETPT
jgi:hypothetical protein